MTVKTHGWIMHVITVLTSYFDLMHLGRKHLSEKCMVLFLFKWLSCFGVTIIAVVEILLPAEGYAFVCVCVCFFFNQCFERKRTNLLPVWKLLKGDNKCVYPFFWFFVCSLFCVFFVCLCVLCGCVFQNGFVCSPLLNMSQFVRSHFVLEN